MFTIKVLFIGEKTIFIGNAYSFSFIPKIKKAKPNQLILKFKSSIM